MWIKLLSRKQKEVISNLEHLIDEKEILLDITVGLARENLMKEIGVIHDSLNFIRHLENMNHAYEELLEIKWAYDRPSNDEIIMGGSK